MGKLPAWAQKECGGSVNGRRDAGGRVMSKYEGGSIMGKGRNVLSEDSKRKIESIDKDSPRGLGNLNALGMGVGVGAALAKGLPRPLRAAGALIGAASGKKVYDDGKQMWKDTGEMASIRRGEAPPGEEDRKSGGRVKKGKR
jgi:hypothetical protein